MRDAATVEQKLRDLARRHATLLAYRNECIRIDDHHGVQDASSDLRELEAAEAALSWVLGTIERLNY